MAKNGKILVCDDDETLCYLIKEQLIEEGFNVEMVYDGGPAIETIKRKSIDVILLDLNMKEVQGEEVIKFVNEYNSSIMVIVLTAQYEIRKAIECIKLGAYDFITKPYDLDELLLAINRAIDHRELLLKNKLLTSRITQTSASKIVGESTQLQRIINLAIKSAQSDSNILIEGETGTGKELFAEFVHRNSTRNDKPFVVINCASLPDQLIESELFGHEKGAFTDAKSTKQGLVEIAHGGTLFLDEIGEMSLTLQPKLLRFLENGEYRRIGGITNLTASVRVICATNRNLIEEADKKNFRKDLLFRLNIITLTIPPLRNRKEDVLILASHFLASKSPLRSPKKLSKEAEQLLLNYQFPGNVRELEHIIERALIFAENELIEAKDLNLPNSNYNSSMSNNDENDEIYSLDELEKRHIYKALNAFQWDRVKSALHLNISQKTLYTKIKKYNLKKE